MSVTGNFFIDQEYEKWRRITTFLREQKDREFINISDLSHDTNVPPHEILNPLTAAGVPLVCAENHTYRVRDILSWLSAQSLSRRKVGNPV